LVRALKASVDNLPEFLESICIRKKLKALTK
jgi:hypothetical protein